MNITAIIPARLESTRLSQKVLADIGGRSMLHRVYQLAVDSKLFDRIIVATDSEIVMTHCITHNINAMITSSSHISGTDRVAEVASMIDTDVIINIQADEPFLEKECIKSLVQLMQNKHVEIGTLTKRVQTLESLLDYNVVKLVKDNYNKVLYFSRQAIPAHRDIAYRKWLDNFNYYQHIGLYGFKKETLLEITKLPVHPLEQSEKLEQLRWLGNGFDVHVSEVTSESFGIDTEEDLLRAREILTNR